MLMEMTTLEQTGVRTTLEQILAPLSLDSFFSEWWDRRPLHISRNDPSYFDSLFSLNWLEEVLQRSDLQIPFILILMADRQIPGAEYTRSLNYKGDSPAANYIDPKKVLEYYSQGATIQINGLEKLSAPLMRLNQSIGVYLGFPTRMTGFLTPPAANNAQAHRDPVDLFAVQLGGRKRWKIWDCPQMLPASAMPRHLNRGGAPSTYKLLHDFTVAEGDTLYVPRGFYHQPMTTDCYSFHISLQAQVYTWYDVVSSVIHQSLIRLGADPEFQKPMPTETLEQEYERLAARMIQEFRREARLKNAMDEIYSRQVKNTYPSRPAQIIDVLNLSGMNLDSRVMIRPGLAYAMIETGASIKLMFHNKEIELPLQVKPTIEHLSSVCRLSVRELASPSDDKEKLALVHRLTIEGFLTFERTDNHHDDHN
jgi:ribosomal protein L16 Arg81 hydroxylase